MRYATREGIFAAASTFGGRWRVTDPAGATVCSLAPAGLAGSDDRVVVPRGRLPVATLMRDRRRVGSWVVYDRSGALLLEATLDGAYELDLSGPEGRPRGRLWATATALVVDLPAPDDLHCVVLALPLYFATTGALRLASLEESLPTPALWG